MTVCSTIIELTSRRVCKESILDRSFRDQGARIEKYRGFLDSLRKCRE